MIIVSACLAGINCNYKGQSKPCEKVIKLVKEGKAIPVCPEILGGLSTPRKATGIYNGLGKDVLIRDAKVRAVDDGEDQTFYYIRGAEEFLKIAKSRNIKTAILRNKSPSCGCGMTWQLDNKFKNHLVNGDGVTTTLLKKNGIKVFSEEDLKDEKLYQKEIIEKED
jgi:uncharacterized protein YbbK (DUF523 family)